MFIALQASRKILTNPLFFLGVYSDAYPVWYPVFKRHLMLIKNTNQGGMGYLPCKSEPANKLLAFIESEI